MSDSQSPDEFGAAGQETAQPEPVQSEHSQPESAPVDLPGKQDSEGWRTLHPLTPLLRGGLFVLVILGIIVANLRDTILSVFFGRFGFDPNDSFNGGDLPEQGEAGEEWRFNIEDPTGGAIDEDYTWLVLAGGIALLLLIIAAVLWLDWRMKTFRVTSEAVESRSGILFKRHRRAPLDRVQGVNLQRPLLARMLGLTMLEVATAGADGKVQLMYLSHSQAKEVRAIILQSVALRRQRRHASDAEHVAGASAAYSLPAPTSIEHPSERSIGDRLQTEAERRLTDIADLDLDPEHERQASLVTIPTPRLPGATVLSWEVLVPFFMLVAALIAGIAEVRGLLFGVLPLAVVTVGAWFSSFTKGMNFHLSRCSQGIRVASGLLSTVTDTIPRGRIHAVEVRQPLFWRPMGWWQVRITTAGVKLTEAGQSGSKNIMLPVGKIADAHAVVHTLLPEHGLSAEQLDEALIGSGGDYVGSPAKARTVLLWGRKRNGIAVSTPAPGVLPTLRIRKGALTRRLVCVPLERFQSIELSMGLLHRILGLASLQAHTVLGPVVAKVNGLEIAVAQRQFREAQRAVLDVQLERVPALEYLDDSDSEGQS